MCYGGLDPKYALREIEAHFAVRKIAASVAPKTNKEPSPGPTGWVSALIARFRQKEATYG